MAYLVFADTCTLINLYLAGRLDVITAIAGTNARWTMTLQDECHRRERAERETREQGKRGLPLDGFADAVEAILPEPLSPNDSEHRSIRQLRAQMASPGDHENKHLGEAEVLTIVDKRCLNALFATDDQRVWGFADENPRCLSVWRLLRLAMNAKSSFITREHVMKVRTELRYHGRFGHAHFSANPDAFNAYLDGDDSVENFDDVAK